MIRVLCWLGAVCGLMGHDMWIEPATFRPAAGQVVGVKLRVGQELLGDAIPRHGRAIREFVVADAAGRRAVPGQEGRDPAGYVKSEAGVIGYWSHPSEAMLGGELFDVYLKEEGLEWALAKRKGSVGMVRDRFSRCAKSLLGGAADRLLGFPLEVLAERNPQSGGVVPVRLTYGGKGVAGALVVAVRRGGGTVRGRTDRDGRVRLAIRGQGMWMIKAVHIEGAATEWESYWASLTFAVGGK
jgi:hypothetical protein